MWKAIRRNGPNLAAQTGTVKTGWLIAVTGMAIALTGCATEPAWRGKPLSTWLAQLNDVHEGRSDQAEVAVRSIGTNALGYLVARLAATTPCFGEALGQKQGEAVLAFRVLGRTAVDSLPTLGKLFTNHASGVSLDAYPIAQSMAAIGKEAQPWLLVGLSDSRSEIRRASLVGLLDLGEMAQGALPSVQQRLRDDDPEVRGFALFFISDVSKDKGLKTRLFTTLLQDPDPHVRLLAEKELAKLGPE